MTKIPDRYLEQSADWMVVHIDDDAAWCIAEQLMGEAMGDKDLLDQILKLANVQKVLRGEGDDADRTGFDKFLDAIPGLGEAVKESIRAWKGDTPGTPGNGASTRLVVSEHTVLDTTTGLAWQRRVPDELFTWNEAVQYAAAMNLDSSSGGWRLPTKDELMGIVDSTHCPCIDHEAFPDTPSDFFWSWPTCSLGRLAWCVDFVNGKADYEHVGVSLRVRCVRG